MVRARIDDRRRRFTRNPGRDHVVRPRVRTASRVQAKDFGQLGGRGGQTVSERLGRRGRGRFCRRRRIVVVVVGPAEDRRQRPTAPEEAFSTASGFQLRLVLQSE